MSDTHLSFIFPAFTSDYSGAPGLNIAGFRDRFHDLLQKASDSIDPKLSEFEFMGNNFPGDELRTQYLTYIYSCAAAAELRKYGFLPSLNAGYSMGIYASLYDAGSISFETGLELIKTAYQCLSGSLDQGLFGMGTLIGLDRNDIQQLIDRASLQVEITNQNASHSFVVSGYRNDIQQLMSLAREEGALHTRDLPVSVPYHSSHLKSGALDFAELTSHLSIHSTQTPVISLIDQNRLYSPAIIREELTRNLYHPLNWFETMHVMLNQQIEKFIECGPSAGLVKNSKFVDGKYRFYSLDSVLKK